MSAQEFPVFAKRPTDVYFFGTCLLDIFMPEAGMDAITLLEQQGIRVHFPMEQLLRSARRFLPATRKKHLTWPKRN